MIKRIIQTSNAIETKLNTLTYFFQEVLNLHKHMKAKGYNSSHVCYTQYQGLAVSPLIYNTIYNVNILTTFITYQSLIVFGKN